VALEERAHRPEGTKRGSKWIYKKAPRARSFRFGFGTAFDSLSMLFDVQQGQVPRCSAQRYRHMAGLGKNLVQVFATLPDLHWEFLRLRTGFELPSSWIALPDYGSNRNRHILDFMRWPHIGLGAQDLNDIQRPK
jgi:hypothetical protein